MFRLFLFYPLFDVSKAGGNAKKYKGKEMEREKKINKKLEYKWHFIFFSLIRADSKIKKEARKQTCEGPFCSDRAKRKKARCPPLQKKIYMNCHTKSYYRLT